ncbi:MAG: SPOR domain-containing protein, partial [Rhodobacteraceae bacterium]
TATRPGALSGKRFVQVGSFGVPANAEAAKARLRALGLPVATGKAGRLTVIYAGPFSSAAALKQALVSAKSAGFSDALLR